MCSKLVVFASYVKKSGIPVAATFQQNLEVKKKKKEGVKLQWAQL